MVITRSSTHSKTGFVAVHQFSQAAAAYGFAQAQAAALGHSVAVRRVAGGFGVSVPCPAPAQPPATTAAVVAHVAAILQQPTPPPGGLCVAYTRAGQPCRRKATHGHYCKQHYSQVG